MADFRKAFSGKPLYQHKSDAPPTPKRPKPTKEELDAHRAARTGREWMRPDGTWREADGSIWMRVPTREPRPGDVVPREIADAMPHRVDPEVHRKHERGSRIYNPLLHRLWGDTRMRLCRPKRRPHGRAKHFKGRTDHEVLDTRYWRNLLDLEYRERKRQSAKKSAAKAKAAKKRRLEMAGYTPEVLAEARKRKRDFKW